MLDTTVAIENPDIIYSSGQSDWVIPMAVLREIDGLKNSEKELVAKAARQLARTLDRLGSYGDLAAGVKLSTGSVLRIVTEHDQVDGLASDADNRIVGTALKLKKEGENIVLLTTDTNMRTVARAYGVKAAFSHKFDISNEELERCRRNMGKGVACEEFPMQSSISHTVTYGDEQPGLARELKGNNMKSQLRIIDFSFIGIIIAGVAAGSMTTVLIAGVMGIFYAALIRPPWANSQATRGTHAYENIANAPHELDPPLDGYGSYRHNSGYSTFHDDQ